MTNHSGFLILCVVTAVTLVTDGLKLAMDKDPNIALNRRQQESITHARNKNRSLREELARVTKSYLDIATQRNKIQSKYWEPSREEELTGDNQPDLDITQHESIIQPRYRQPSREELTGDSQPDLDITQHESIIQPRYRKLSRGRESTAERHPSTKHLAASDLVTDKKLYKNIMQQGNTRHLTYKTQTETEKQARNMLSFWDLVQNRNTGQSGYEEIAGGQDDMTQPENIIPSIYRENSRNRESAEDKQPSFGIMDYLNTPQPGDGDIAEDMQPDRNLMQEQKIVGSSYTDSLRSGIAALHKQPGLGITKQINTIKFRHREPPRGRESVGNKQAGWNLIQDEDTIQPWYREPSRDAHLVGDKQPGSDITEDGNIIKSRYREPSRDAHLVGDKQPGSDITKDGNIIKSRYREPSRDAHLVGDKQPGSDITEDGNIIKSRYREPSRDAHLVGDKQPSSDITEDGNIIKSRYREPSRDAHLVGDKQPGSDITEEENIIKSRYREPSREKEPEEDEQPLWDITPQGNLIQSRHRKPSTEGEPAIDSHSDLNTTSHWNIIQSRRRKQPGTRTQQAAPKSPVDIEAATKETRITEGNSMYRHGYRGVCNSKSKNNNSSSNCLNLTKEIKNLKTQFSVFSNKLTSCTLKTSELDKIVKILQSDRAAASRALAELRKGNRQLQKDISVLKKEATSLKIELIEMKASNSALKKDLTTLKESTQKSGLSCWNETTSVNNSHNVLEGNCANNVDQSTGEINKTHEELKEIKENSAAFQTKTKALFRNMLKNISLLQNENAALRKRLQNLGPKSAGQPAKTVVRDTSKDIEKLRDADKKLKEQIENLRTATLFNHSLLSQQLNMTSKQIILFREDNEDIKKLIQDMKENNFIIQKKLNEGLKNFSEGQDVLKNHSITVNTEIQELKQQANIVHNELKDIRQKTSSMENDFVVLKQNVEAIVTKLDLPSTNIVTAKFEKQSRRVNRVPCYRGMPHDKPRVIVPIDNHMFLCDTQTDGGGWIIIQRRTKGDVDFYRGWDDYKKGFGTLETDFWIGNDAIHKLTSQGYTELRIDMDMDNTSYYATYSHFSVGDEQSKYLLTISGYNGTAGDALSDVHNGMMFSTYDSDNDLASENCAEQYKGAWWYEKCHESNLNGKWGKSTDRGIVWHGISGSKSLTFTDMKLRLSPNKGNFTFIGRA